MSAEADFVKTVLPCRREPHSRGLRTLKNDIRAMIAWKVFLDAMWGAILDDFGHHFRIHFGAVSGFCAHDFRKEVLHGILPWCD